MRSVREQGALVDSNLRHFQAHWNGRTNWGGARSTRYREHGASFVLSLIARSTLTSVKGLMPERFEGLPARVSAFRQRLGAMRVLVALRGICARYLHALSAPLGLVPRPTQSLYGLISDLLLRLHAS